MIYLILVIFFGGTTVGLLSLASIIFVTAAIIMQKEELRLQREELEKTREEYKMTNTTMKKQQFDSTFFNMINLHHNITKDIIIGSKTGRVAMESIHAHLSSVYKQTTFREYCDEFIDEILNGGSNKNELDNFTLLCYFNYREPYHSLKHILVDAVITEEKIKEIEGLTEREVLEQLRNIKKNIPDSINKLWIEQFQYKGFKPYDSDDYYYNKLKKDFFENTIEKVKRSTIERVYRQFESQLGHYFRNLYHIIKFIQEEQFSEDDTKNNEERRKYRGILRAQLSSIEMIILFYNIVYSKNGKKFRNLLLNTRFFEDHLDPSKIIWKNDEDELKKLDS